MQKYNAMIGTMLNGRYILLSIIGVGGMAVVFSAFDKETGNTVAVKMLREDSDDVREFPAFKSQFVNEAGALAKLSHNGIVRFYDSSLKSSPMFFVMEYVDGITLKDYMSRKRVLTQSETIDFSMQLLSILAHLHSKGIVHCDIKPHNVILMKNGKLKLTDFGIARVPGVILDLPADRAVGTVYYVSPEQAEGKVLDHRSDLYSLGIMMYEMASGKLPFMSNDIDKVARMQSSAPPKRPRTINPEISKGLEQIILKAISKKAYMRFSDATQMRQYLDILRKNPSAVFRLQEKPASASSAVYHSHSTYAVIAGILCAAILTSAIAIPSVKKKISTSIDGDGVSITVPELKGKSLDYAAKKLNEGLYDIEIIYDYNARSVGKVISQFPSSGEVFKIDPTTEQCLITLTVGAKKEKLTMVDITSLTPQEAKDTLVKLGYSVIFEEVYSDTVDSGLACGTLPARGEAVDAGSEVTVYVSIGADLSFVLVPSFSQKSESEAAARLKALGLRVGRVTYKASAYPKGTVLSQSIEAGENIPEGTAIDFTVSGGPNYNP